jgi:hypothetical protein
MLKDKDPITSFVDLHTLVKNELYVIGFYENHNFNHNSTIITPHTPCIISSQGQCSNISSPCLQLQPKQTKGICIDNKLDNLLWSSLSPKTINYQKFYCPPFIFLHNIKFWILKGTFEWFCHLQLLRPSFDTF